MNIEYIAQCQCGAYTITIDGEEYSMSEETFKEKFVHEKVELENVQTNLYVNCNHCVNHWGIDLCACGSGETPEECTENIEGFCGKPMQILGEVEKKPLWRF